MDAIFRFIEEDEINKSPKINIYNRALVYANASMSNAKFARTNL